MKIGIIGAAGRMGQAHIREILQTSGCELSGGLEKPGSNAIGQDLGILVGKEPINVAITDDIDTVVSDAEAIIDFSTPETTLEIAKSASSHGTALIIGTTGLDDMAMNTLIDYAKDIVIVHAHNMSLGVTLLQELVEIAASKLQDEYDIEILEMHHKHKVDAPSGTALSLGKAAANGRNKALDDVACYAREGNVGERGKDEIGFATLRGGDVIGDHTVIFAGEGERIELTHKASSRTVFSHGAVKAAIWTKDQPAGFYSMKDVLGI